MARRANRQDRIDKKEKVSRAASYVRLSRIEKGNEIIHQKAIIREYVKAQKDIQIVLEIEDCNQSGTNFSRKGFDALIKAIEKQEVDCVIVKDLSRFGRNLQEVSEYLEQVFPRLGVRFISVLDGYDSKKEGYLEELLLLQVKCLFHERYAKDISRKIHTTLELMKNRGDFVGSVPYGYCKGKQGTVVVTGAAEGVQRIYQLALAGMSDKAIAAELDELGYATPLEYQKDGILQKKKKGESRRWQPSSVKRILENKVYTGKQICHKSEQYFYKGEKRKKVEQDQWICVENKYPAIITEEIFRRVQRIRHKN